MLIEQFIEFKLKGPEPPQIQIQWYVYSFMYTYNWLFL